jgi:hypothetical protein
MRGLAAAFVLLLAAGPTLYAASDEPTQWLAQADRDFASGLAGRAAGSYEAFLHGYPDHPRADYAIYMVGESCRLARAQMIVPAFYFTEFGPDSGSQQCRGVAHYLAQAYGMYADVSEGDSYWYYDMRAYRELLKRYPKSSYADDCEFLLVEPQQQRRAWAIGMGPEVAETARRLIGAYEAILRKFPDTNRRVDIEGAVRELREIERRNAPAPPEAQRQPGAVRRDR